MNLSSSTEEVVLRLTELIESNHINTPEEFEEMRLAGLTGPQLNLKLESFEHSLIEFENDGGIDNLELTLAKAEVLLKSLAGAVPGFGSFAQELLDYILKELKKSI